MELIQYSLNNWQFKNKNEFINSMNNELKSVKESFFKLGMYLSEAYVKRYNNGTGIDDYFEWCNLLFGIQKSSVYNLMRIYNVFRDKNRSDIGIIDERYSQFNQSQLIELLPASHDLEKLQFISPSDNVATIRKVVQIHKKMCNRAHVECYSSDEYINRFSAVLNTKSELSNSKKLKGCDARNACYFTLMNEFKIDSSLASDIANRLIYEILNL